MLLVLMYHRVGEGKHANRLEMLKDHLCFLKDHYPLVLPGDPLPQKRLSLCLTFDDATFDFYHLLFPLLQQLKIRVVLGVPVGYILEKSMLPAKERLSVPYPLMMQEGIFETKVPFCTWCELEEMVASGHVEVAAHSYFHCNLTFEFVNFTREVISSKKLLEERLHQSVSSFIYPFGKVTPSLQRRVSAHYPYTFRIGSYLNWGWGNGRMPLARLPADQLPYPEAPLAYPTLLKAWLKGRYRQLGQMF